MISSPFEKVSAFHIRASFPNLRNLLNSIERRCSRQRSPALPGHLPPQIDCELSEAHGVRPQTIQVRDLDLLLLADVDTDRAQLYLSSILHARSGDPEAQKAIQEQLDLLFRHHLPSTFSPPITENEYIIPCLTHNTYPLEQVSHKGSILLRLIQDGFAVPDFVIYSANNYPLPENHRQANAADALRTLDALALPSLNPQKLPLVFAIRCAMPVYIPGMMHTFLNVGVTKANLDVLADIYGELPAKRMFLNNLKNFLAMVDPSRYEGLIKESRQHLSAHAIDSLLDTMVGLVESRDPVFLENPLAQTHFFVEKAYAHFEENIDLLVTFMGKAQHYPSLILQKMICTVRHPRAQAGVLFSRHPRTGLGMQLQIGHNLFGEDIMTGTVEPEEFSFAHGDERKNRFPAVSHFSHQLPKLEEELRSPVTVEFAVDATNRFELFALLQLNCSELSGRAAFTSIMDLYRRGTISRQRVIELIRPFHFKQLESDTIDSESFAHLQPFSPGVSVLPRTALSARAYFSAQPALLAKKRKEKVCILQERFVPSDTVIMRELDAIVCGAPAAIHVATLCQGYGIPALLNLAKYGNYFSSSRTDGRRCIVNSRGEEVAEGDWITISSSRQMLYKGRATYTPARLIRYMEGKEVSLTEEESRWFAELAQAYRDYQALVSSLELRKIAGVRDLIRLVRYEFKGDVAKQKAMVNDWYDENPDVYLAEVFGCEMGAHLNQQTIYHLLTMGRQIEFFRRATEKCIKEKRSGLAAGSFCLGRFINNPHPVRFWQALEAEKIAVLINEWVLFEKYMDVLTRVGERKITRAREELQNGHLRALGLSFATVKPFITLKLSGCDLGDVLSRLPEGGDPQAREVIALLQQPYGEFYHYDSPWSLGQLRQICQEEGLALPDATDT